MTEENALPQALREPLWKKVLCSSTLFDIIKRVEGFRASVFPQMCKTLWKVCESRSTPLFPLSALALLSIPAVRSHVPYPA